MDLSSEKSFRIIEFILENKVFGQRQISKELKISVGQVNKVVNWLKMKKLAKREANRYKVADVAGILFAISVFRHMEQLKSLSLSLRLDKKEVMKMLPKGVILCLESASAFHSPHYISNRVCVYANEKELKKITETFSGYEGSQTLLLAYNPLPSIKPVKSNNFLITPKIRTVIDLVCDDKTFVADPLFKELWGIKLG